MWKMILQLYKAYMKGNFQFLNIQANTYLTRKLQIAYKKNTSCHEITAVASVENITQHGITASQMQCLNKASLHIG